MEMLYIYFIILVCARRCFKKYFVTVLLGLNVASTETSSQLNGQIEQKSSVDPPKVAEDNIDRELWDEKWDLGTKSGLNKVDNLKPDPWDLSYLTENEIKFMSFHSYMRKLTSGADKGKFARLEKMITARKLDSGNNKRLLSEMPSSITLNRQPYRHVDNVCFQNREIMDRYLERWRMTGHQQAAWLFGTYSKHEDVPLGIRCNVDVIYPMSQEYRNSKLKLNDDPNDKIIVEIAKRLGMQRVGWIITDLDPDKDGMVKNVRNGDTHFVTAEGNYNAHFSSPI